MNAFIFGSALEMAAGFASVVTVFVAMVLESIRGILKV